MFFITTKIMDDRSTNLDTWSQDQLKLMSSGGNARASVFFKQHGWTDVGKIEAKYTSKAAELYKQLLIKDVAKSVVASPRPVLFSSEPGIPPAETLVVNDMYFEGEAPNLDKDNCFTAQNKTPAAVAGTPSASTLKKTTVLGARKLGATKSGGTLGVKKLTNKSQSLYDQKPAEVTPDPVGPTKKSPPRTSRFVYAEDELTSSIESSGSGHSGHVVAPSPSDNFFSDTWKPNTSSYVQPKQNLQIEESNEAQKKFANAKSISSTQFFRDEDKVWDGDNHMRLQKFASSSSISSNEFFNRDEKLPCASSADNSGSQLVSKLSLQASQDISALKTIAGQTGKKLTSLASNLIADLQQRIK
ncbi:hypothetical protein O6H91_01G015600 [Diphasiastrum complanatum]|uniref:Uncharacterized protein n=1 Tax=Diphasiastrum complanatum TaxID=34168 RepID=A0ACC2ENG9_DIPCM|nr:hypothetical protein O6H91_01G015600 [Diphasiastrum complanatum]